MRLGLSIAARFLKSNRGQTILIILGIAIGVSVQIFIGSLIQGLQKGLVEKTIGNSSQITVTPQKEGGMILDYSSVIQEITNSDENIEEVSAALDNSAFFEFNGNSKTLLVRGFEIDKADGIYDLKAAIKEGSYPEDEYEMILGVDLRDEYDIKLNDTVLITTFTQEKHELEVVGFFDLKVASLNSGWGITTIETAQGIFKEEGASSIEIQLDSDSVFLADGVADRLAAGLEGDYAITNWKAQNESLLSGLQGQNISSYMIQIFVMVSVVLAITSVLAISVIQKSRQIGILKAMGIRNSSTSYIFLFQGLILGIFGAVAGILLGLGLSVAFTKFALNPDGTPVVDLYVNFSFIALSGAIAVLASVVASLMPAVRSSKLNPIDIIRNN